MSDVDPTVVLGLLLPAVPFGLAMIGLLLPLSRPPQPEHPAAGAVPHDQSGHHDRTGASHQSRDRVLAAGLGVGGAAAALVLSVALLIRLDGTVEASHRWADFGALTVTLGVRIDPAAALVAVAVATVALAVQVYSIGYLHDDERYPPYAAQVSLFTAAMLLVVVAGDLILLLVGWEVMGICSYLLIGHDRRLPEAPAAAMKAFLVTRVGDVGFLLGIAVLGSAVGSFRIADVLAYDLTDRTAVVAGLLLLAGVAGKSAQFPLHTWLPDAMAGPTPISALIHAATMVAAGIYAVTRLYPLFARAPVTLAVLGVLAATTLLLGAFAATAQDDIKRVLAWSTVSQIGYMAGALAVGSPPAALFHLLTHAAFKALLFLAAGCVIHAVGSNLMSTMGGLRRDMPITFWCTIVGLGALVGVPPLSGFWSKDGILVVAQRAALDGTGPTPSWVGWVVWLAGLLGVAVTAWYATRLLLRTFFGEPREGSAPAPPEASGVLRWPVLLLAVPSAFLGLAVFAAPFRSALALDEAHVDGFVLLPVALLAAGAGHAWWLWRRQPREAPPWPVFARAFWLDDLQRALVVRPVRALAHAARDADESMIDELVEGTGRGTAGLGGLLAGLHRGSLPRAATAVLAGALLLGLAATVIGGAR